MAEMMAEILLESNIISKMVEEERKMEEDLDFLYDNNVCQKKDNENEKKLNLIARPE